MTVPDMPGLVCPEHRLPLDPAPGALICPKGCRHPVVGGIARLVPPDHYARRFGLQWNEFARTQLDSRTGLPISRDRLARICGGSLDALSGKQVLEAGCGAGRFTEVMLDAGAKVTAIDLSSAVEANMANNGKRPGLAIHQADIMNLPFEPETFDVVVCVGVLQATPDPEKAIASLAARLKPGGLLAIDHYGLDYAVTPSRQLMRKLLLALPEGWSIPLTKATVALLWPLHRLAWALRRLPGMARVREKFLGLSPVVDYQGIYGQLPLSILREWAVLDTHDTVSDTFKHLRGVEDLRRVLEELGLEDVVSVRGGNGVEARGVKPSVTSRTAA